MRFMIIVCFVFSVACGRVQVKPQPEPSPTTIEIVVTKDAVLGGKVHKRAEALIREDILKHNIGVPVAAGAKADVTLKVEITRANFGAATAYEWQLIENEFNQIIAQGTASPAMGHNEKKIADQVLTNMIKIDTRQYAKIGDRKPPVVKRATAKMPESKTVSDNAWAVIIGITSYRNELAEAPFADADARAFEAFAATTLGVPEKQIKTLTNENASRADIAAALFEWLPRNAVNDGGKVYVFFSGHGAPNVETGDAYLVPYDADPAYLKTGGIAVADVQESLSNLKGQTAFLFLDSCFSGSGSRGVLAEGTRPLVPVKETIAKKNLVTFTASKANQTTGIKKDAQHGLFTHFLLAGMTGAADKNADKNVTLEELVSYTTTNVEIEARQSNRDQQPSAQIPDVVNASTHVVVQGLE